MTRKIPVTQQHEHGLKVGYSVASTVASFVAVVEAGTYLTRGGGLISTSG